MNNRINNVKHPVLEGLLLLFLGLGGLFVLKALHFFTSDFPSFLQTLAPIACSCLLAAGAVILFLHFFKPKMK